MSNVRPNRWLVLLLGAVVFFSSLFFVKYSVHRVDARHDQCMELAEQALPSMNQTDSQSGMPTLGELLANRRAWARVKPCSTEMTDAPLAAVRYNETLRRTAYLLTMNASAPRALFAHKTIRSMGFDVEVVSPIPLKDKVLSNKFGLLRIYKLISQGAAPWGYVFEDDVDLLQPVVLEDIVRYEHLGRDAFYLGVCAHPSKGLALSPFTLKGHCVRFTNPCEISRCQHAVAVSKRGASELHEDGMRSFVEGVSRFDIRYMDVILEKFAWKKHGLPVVRGDLHEGGWLPFATNNDHHGVVFQNRDKFKSTIASG